VELCARYSNRDDLLEPLVSVLEQINTGTPASAAEDQLVSADGATPTAWRVADRLSDTDIGHLIAAYQAGDTVREVAERFNLGTTTVKRLLRKHRARRKDQRAESA
jgi:hypothetical protein